LLAFHFLVFRGGSTPLHQSSFNGHLEVCHFLVESKADLRAKDRQDFHPSNTFFDDACRVFLFVVSILIPDV
jgi:ankyrin repeat protein